MGEVLIRQMRAEDVDVCARIMAENELWQRYGVTLESARTRFQRGIAEQATVLIAVLDGQPSGFCWVVLRGAFDRSGYIALIGVDPEQKRAGIGRKLLEAAEALVAEHAADMFLTVSDFNREAQRFYDKMGYQVIGVIPAYVKPGINEILMRKKLVKQS